MGLTSLGETLQRDPRRAEKKLRPDGSRTIYVGGIYEVDKSSGGTVTGTKTYYPVAGAMRINSTLYYVLKDHLGSASVVTEADGDVVGEQRYYPFGETRWSSGNMFTDKLFTGQREMADLGIYHYQARFFSPYINRFFHPDIENAPPCYQAGRFRFSNSADISGSADMQVRSASSSSCTTSFTPSTSTIKNKNMIYICCALGL